MNKPHLILLALTAAALPTLLSASPASDDAALRALDQRQRMAAQSLDPAAMDALAHPNLVINAPSSRIIGRAELLAMIGKGGIATERFERVAEQVTVTGDVAVVMGRETVTPAAGSEGGIMFGTKPLNRRYTNIYLRDGDSWKFLARHANVVPPAPAR